MITKKSALFPALSVIFIFALTDNTTGASKAPTVPGTYVDWNREVDEVTILQSFRLDDYNDIAVESFDSAGVALPSPKDNTYEAVRSARDTIKPAFIQGFREHLRQKPGGVKLARGKGKTLVIRARLIKLDPGSQAARYWVSFGAGAVKVQMLGEVVDSVSHKTLVRFKQERRSGAGLFGGNYSELFVRTARQIGGDVAGLLNAF